jgi:hypothetical protein
MCTPNAPRGRSRLGGPFAVIVLAVSIGNCSPGKVIATGSGGGGSGAAGNDGGAGGSLGGRGSAATGGGSGLVFNIDASAGGHPSTATTCKNLQCQQTVCPSGSETTLSGTAYAPNGTLPLFNAIVYVPNAALAPFSTELTCDRCGALPSGDPLVSAITDSHGRFTLKNVPDGKDIPLVIQVGRWRRQVTIPSVPACTTTTITDHELTRLARNRKEGDLPRIAITTGSCDSLVCLLQKIGIDPAEWGVAGEDKPVTLYRGFENAYYDPYAATRFDAHLNTMTSASTLWGDYSKLSKYDIALFSCECGEFEDNKGATAYDVVTHYLAQGGRVFGTDYQYIWYKRSTDTQLRAAFGVPASSEPATGLTVTLATAFPKGKALAEWYAFLNPPPASEYGKILCEDVFDNFTSAAQPATQVWGSSEQGSPNTQHPRFITMNTPVGLPTEHQCGRAVHLAAHISNADPSKMRKFPDDCASFLAAGEMVMAFFLFDAAACLQDDVKPVEPPPVIK